MSDDRRHRLGALGEELAAQHLQRLGFEIVERNYRTRWGELDIVAFDGATLVFCEVKSRRLDGDQTAVFDALHVRKRTQVRRMAAAWLCERSSRPYTEALRFDAIGVSFDRSGRLAGIDHLEAAF